MRMIVYGNFLCILFVQFNVVLLANCSCSAIDMYYHHMVPSAIREDAECPKARTRARAQCDEADKLDWSLADLATLK